MEMFGKVRRMFFRDGKSPLCRCNSNRARHTSSTGAKSTCDRRRLAQDLAAHLKLCFSRAFVVQAYPTQSHEMLFDAHTRAFAALGGIPRRGIYDNMKTAVDKVKKGKSRVVNTRFAAMASHYLFDPDFCNVASGWEKGVVEKNVQDSRLRSGRTRQGALWFLHRTEPVAAGEVPGPVAGTQAPRVRPDPGRNARTGAAQPDADDHAVRRLRRDSGQGLQHLPGHVRRSEPLLGAVRTGRPDGQHPDLSRAIDLVAHDAVVASHVRSFGATKHATTGNTTFR
jgi:hypothetical protein